MEFGSAPDLDKIDLSLPPDHPETAAVLKKGLSKKMKPKFYYGCAKWGRKDWVGILYPPKTKEKDFLPEFSKHFNSIELNSTYYRIPTPSMIKGWAEKTEDDFIFCPKFSKVAGPSRNLNPLNVELFLEATQAFGKKLGPYFLMLDQRFSIKSFPVLKEFIESLPKLDLFLEFRHESWFEKTPEANDAFEYLRQKNIGSIITDVAGRRDILHQRLTTDSAFIRFVGNFLHPTDYTRIDDWAYRVKEWLNKGLKNVYFFMHHNSDEGEIHSPELSVYAVNKFNEVWGSDLNVPRLVTAEERKAAGKKLKAGNPGLF